MIDEPNAVIYMHADLRSIGQLELAALEAETFAMQARRCALALKSGVSEPLNIDRLLAVLQSTAKRAVAMTPSVEGARLVLERPEA